MTALRVAGLTFGYGANPTVSDIALHAAPGERVAVLGGNGAGKSTVLKLVAGLERPWSGSITVDGRPLPTGSMHRTARRGVRFVPQGHPVFASLTVDECLRLAVDVGRHTADCTTKLTVDEALDLFPRLRERLGVRASALSGGERALLGVAQPLVAGCSLLLLDEPSAGLSPGAMVQFFEVLAEVGATTDTTMVIVEQNAYAVLPVCARAYVMAGGRISVEGPAAELQGNQKVVDAYLAF